MDVTAKAAAVKLAVVEPDATVTAAGTPSRSLLLASETTAPPLGAGEFKVTVHVLLAPDPKVEGLQVRPERPAGATRLSE